jgi:4-hydroxy-3-methylbut-2-enyl diphosphate reductase
MTVDVTAADTSASPVAFSLVREPQDLRAGAAMIANSAERAYRNLLIGSPTSFCTGVERAIDIVRELLGRNGPPVYVRKQIVHNVHVLAELSERGAVFVDELDEVPDGALTVFSAHGVSPAVRQTAEARGLRVVDATCPLVARVHAKARRFARAGHTLLLIGHAGHEETEGTLGEAPDRTLIIENEQDAEAVEVPDPRHVAYLTQTTLTAEDTAGIVAVLRRRFPAITDGGQDDDICFATTNRQRAARAVAEKADLVLVVGSANSSNSQRLVDVARTAGVPAWLIDDASGLDPRWLDGVRSVGLLAGASAPRHLLDGVITALRSCGGADTAEISVADESGIVFALPAAQLDAVSRATPGGTDGKDS